jgi:hypothetical protein
MEDKMKKTNLQSDFLTTQVNVNFDVITNVKIDKGGGGAEKLSLKIIVMIILMGFFLVPFLVLLLLSFLL